MHQRWAEKIYKGAKPSELLLEVLAVEPDLSGRQLAEILMAEFPGIHHHVGPFVARWIRPGSKVIHGLTTEDMDQRVLGLIAEWRNSNQAP